LADDAGIYRLTDNLALVQSVDFFTPIVDDPETFGRIAAANALSDIYAVGATPVIALNILVYPAASVSPSAAAKILKGGSSIATEAGTTLIGGHTVEGEEPLYGMAVTGTVHPDSFLSPSGAKAGDALVLTKPLGTGIISTALKAGSAKPADVDAAIASMTQLNRAASTAMVRLGAHAATDVTGFGLAGHLSDMMRASGMPAQIDAAALPFLPNVLGYADQGFTSRGLTTNREHYSPLISFGDGVSSAARAVAFDPQTSGGLLVAIGPDLAERLTAEITGAAVIGRVMQEGRAGSVVVR
jgi:selenide,water dikinase